MGPLATSTIAIGPNSTCVRACLAPVRTANTIFIIVLITGVRLRPNEFFCNNDSHPNMSRVGILGPSFEPLSRQRRLCMTVYCVSCSVGVMRKGSRNRWHARHCRQSITGVLRQPIQDTQLADHGGGVEDASNAEFKIIAAEPDGWSRRGPRARQALCSNWPASASLRVWGPGESPPSRQECQVAGSWPPVLAAARGAQAQISVVKRWWGPQIPGPFILPMCSS